MDTITPFDEVPLNFIDGLLDGLTDTNADATGERDGRDLAFVVQGDGKTTGVCCSSFTFRKTSAGRAWTAVS